jgi:N6-L-threonylcarbamoyladenine synthase
LYSAWISPAEEEEEMEPPPEFPLLALIVSGGHTELILMSEHLSYERLGGTLDDAAGEAFDKIARLLDLGYPGGPQVQKAAELGGPQAFKFPRAWLEGTWNFSFSGLKTAVLHQVRALRVKMGVGENDESVELPVADLAASFQAAVVDVLVTKTRFAAQEFGVKELLVAGGVSANKRLREYITKDAPGRVHVPPLHLCTDNAAMIAAAGYYRYVLGNMDDLDIDAMPTWPLSEVA